jgi:hypothetical protein
MNLGAYMCYVAGDELENEWRARCIMVPTMDYPDEPTKLGGTTNQFQIEESYGLPAFYDPMRSALGIILREHGYNDEGSYNREAHGGRYQNAYIYNDSDSDRYTDRITRRGGSYGTLGTGAQGGTRYNMLTKEIWDEASARCLEKILSGSFMMSSDGAQKEFSTAEDCEFFSENTVLPRGKTTYVVPSYNLAEEMNEIGLLSKDLFRNYRHVMGTPETISFMFGYNGAMHDELNIHEISNDDLRRMKSMVTVEKVKPLTTVRGRNAPAAVA